MSDDLVTVEKLTELSPGGLFSVSTRLFLGAEEVPPERFCGPDAFLFDLYQPGDFLDRAERVLSGEFGDMRGTLPLLRP